MTYDLDIKNEELRYVGAFSRPAFELWGQGGKMAQGLFNALSPYGGSLANIQPTAYTPSAADPVFTVRIGQNGVCKLMLDKIELSFSNLSDEFLASIPTILRASTGWIREAVPSLNFSIHQSTYFCHSLFKTGTLDSLLKTVNPTNLKSAGTSLGNGAMFNYSLPTRNWTTQIAIDRSLALSGGLYVSFTIWERTNLLDYDKLLQEGRTYLTGILRELNVTLPGLSQ